MPVGQPLYIVLCALGGGVLFLLTAPIWTRLLRAFWKGVTHQVNEGGSVLENKDTPKRPRGRPESGQSSGAYAIFIAFAVVVVLGIIVLAAFVKRVDPGHVGILVDYGAGTAANEPKLTPIQPGQFKFVKPLQRLAEYTISQQTLTMVRREEEGQIKGDDSVDCRDKGGIKINIDSSSLWRIDPLQAGQLYLLRPGFPLTGEASIESDIVRREVRSAVAVACSQYKYDEIYGARRIEFGQTVTEYLGKSLARSYLILDGFILGEIYLPPEQQEAVDRKARAEQAAQEAAFLAEKARNEAQAAIAEAEGQKQVVILQAQAQAEAVRVINEELGNSPYYVKYLYASKWDGALPVTLVIADGSEFPLLGAIQLDSISPAATPEVPGGGN